MSTSQLSPGTVVDGRFTVGAVLRTRVGATTYEATDSDGTSVALTIYDEACFPSSLVLERGLRELRQLQSMPTRRILPVVASGRYGDGLFEATQPAPERTLAQYLKAGPLALRDAAGILMQVGEALLEALPHGVFHRNLGADVVFPSPSGVRVTGFVVGEPHTETSCGSLATMAPEQVEGKVVEQRTLIYNLAALMHWMLQGRPLFEGSPEDVLRHHAETEPDDTVHEALRRALNKDARLRPMMLKAFLGDLAELAGIEPPRELDEAAAAEPPAGNAPVADAATPTSRGWTMFMAAGEEEERKAAEAKKAAAPAAEVKPTTRGWTMFMNADEDEDDDEPAAPAPARPVEPQPVAPEPTPEDEAKPSTRGWTMFMTADEAEEPDDAPAEGGAPAGVSAEPSKPIPAAAEVKPSTRGWTMFMNADEDEEDDEAPAPAPVSAAPAPASEPASPAASPAPSPAPAADEVKPSTRGWTMFMQNEEESDDDAAPAAPAPATSTPAASSPAAPAEPRRPASGPAVAATGASAKAPEDDAARPSAASGTTGSKSRGWTIFMEPAKDGAKPPAAAPTPSSSTSSTSPSTPPASASPRTEPKAPAAAPAEEPAPALAQKPIPGAAGGQKKRGWTMFMNAPIPELKKPGGPQAPALGSSSSSPLGSQPLVSTPKAGPGPAPGAGPNAGTSESDTRGWTVFGAPSPMRTPAAPPLTPPPGVKPATARPAEPPRGGTMIAEAPSVRPEPAAGSPAPTAAEAPASTIPAPTAVPPTAAPAASLPSAVTPTSAVASESRELAATESDAMAKPGKRTGTLVAVVVGLGFAAGLAVWLLG